MLTPKETTAHAKATIAFIERNDMDLEPYITELKKIFYKDNREKEFTVYCYNQDNEGNLKNAQESGNITETNVLESDWEKFKLMIEFATMNFSSGHVIEIFLNGKFIKKACTQMPPSLKKLTEAIPVFDTVHVLSIGYPEGVSETFTTSGWDELLRQFVDWCDNDCLEGQYKGYTTCLVEMKSLRNKIIGNDYEDGDMTKYFQKYFDHTNANYHYIIDHDEHELETTYKHDLEQLKNK
jgi:hypothetical protein